MAHVVAALQQREHDHGTTAHVFRVVTARTAAKIIEGAFPFSRDVNRHSFKSRIVDGWLR
jgi:hypothetical protein